jgi:hypothetical protein
VLLNRLSPTKEQSIRQILRLKEMGERKPPQFLMHLRGLAPDLRKYLYSIGSSRLSPMYNPLTPTSLRLRWMPRSTV